jgi:hypothetical protein
MVARLSMIRTAEDVYRDRSITSVSQLEKAVAVRRTVPLRTRTVGHDRFPFRTEQCSASVDSGHLSVDQVGHRIVHLLQVVAVEVVVRHAA